MTYTDKLIDYLIEGGGCDICGKCVNFVPWTEEDEQKYGDELVTCKATKSRDKAPSTKTCREGMKRWFKINSPETRKMSDYFFRKQHRLCVVCGRKKAREGKTTCEDCSVNMSLNYYDKYKKRIVRIQNERAAQGLCPYCGLEPPTKGYKTCKTCRQRAKSYHDKKRAKQ